MIQCPRCEEDLPEAAGYCGSCGYAIAPFGRDNGGQSLARGGHRFPPGEGEERLRASTATLSMVRPRSGPPMWAVVLTLANALVFGGSVTLFLMGANRAVMLPAGAVAVPPVAFGYAPPPAAPPPGAVAVAPTPAPAPEPAPAPPPPAAAPAPAPPPPVAVAPSKPARTAAKPARAARRTVVAAAPKPEKVAAAPRAKKRKTKGPLAVLVETPIAETAPAAEAAASGEPAQPATQAPAPELPSPPAGAAPRPLAPPQGPQAAPASTESAAPPRGIDSEGIRLVIRRYLPQMRACYERELKNDSDIRGTVEVRFTIDADGKVTDAEHVGGTLQSAAVGSCVSARVKRWKFPRPAAGRVDLIYPFSFSPY